MRAHAAGLPAAGGTGPVGRLRGPPRPARDSGSASPRRRAAGWRTTRRPGAACRRRRRDPRRGAARAAARGPPGARPRARRRPSVASSSTASGSRHEGRLWAMSPPTMKVRSSSGARSCRALRVSTVKDGPPRSTSIRDTPKRLVAADRQLGTAHAGLRRRGRPRPPCAAGRRPGPGGPGRARAARGLLGHDQVAEVRRVERPAEEAEPRDYPRTWPSPRTTYFVVHSSRMPIGPRACSFWVELPISAPMPNSPPSVKRVEALT